VLLDLGFAHRPGENTAIVGAGYVMGTANYLAPELCRDAEEFGMAGDLFSLGVMLYEMLTGRLPYPVGSIDQTLRRHAIDPPADIARHLPLLPPLLGRVIERLLARKPEDRPTAAKVVRQLIDLEITGLGRRRAG
jgi:serine/threonine protein kinase